MKKIYKYLLMTVIASGTMFYSCDTLELEDLTDPNSLSPDLADADLLLNTIQLNFLGAMQDQQSNGSALGRITNMFGRVYYNNFGSGTVSGSWGALYSGIMPDIAAIESQNGEDNTLAFHLGISKAMAAHILMGLVDAVGDVPYSEANNPVDYPSPGTDDDAQVYADALALLDVAEGHLDSALGGDDLFYGGDISKWKKYINTLRLRYHLTTGDYTAALTQTNVIETAADDMYFSYGDAELQPDTRHPWYSSDYTDSGANRYASTWLMNQMIGGSAQWFNLWTGTPQEEIVVDPRRRYYFYRQSWNTPGGISLITLDVNGGAYVYPDAFGADNTNLTTLQCSGQPAPIHIQLTPDEDIWCSTALGYWGRAHGNDEGTPPDNFTRTAVGVYPAGGSYDNQNEFPTYVNGSGDLGFPTGAVGRGNGGGGAGIWPIYMSSYVKFMKAEAAMWLAQTDAAAVFMQQGIEESIARVQSMGIVDPDADATMFPSAAYNATFVANIMAEFNAAPTTTAYDATIMYPSAKYKMDILGEQYLVALYGGANDAWNFIRRTGYPRTLQRSLSDPGESGPFPRTGTYPSGEVSANPSINQRPDNNTLVFWDAGVLNPAN
ncbi:MAG: SusD/RagB family nutrient-binding outer membrane lipoprotein [Flavobacteriaceae bacterium]|nr:SusD/RagB family nutrient-binding outer membrane lipoprotein [Flavobacteriaceae bacterium]